MHTTIGAYAFHFRVRNGIGWFHAAIITRERVEGRRPWTDYSGHGSAHALIGTWDVVRFASNVDASVESKAT